MTFICCEAEKVALLSASDRAEIQLAVGPEVLRSEFVDGFSFDLGKIL